VTDRERGHGHDTAKDVQALRAKKAQLQTAVANQELSASDVEAMKFSLSKLEERCGPRHPPPFSFSFPGSV
jgi:hypothetical protein